MKALTQDFRLTSVVKMITIGMPPMDKKDVLTFQGPIARMAL